MNHLTESERAYRRGCLQCLQFLLTDPIFKDVKVPVYVALRLARWHEELVKGRVSLDPKYLGTYMDEIRARIGIPSNSINHHSVSSLPEDACNMCSGYGTITGKDRDDEMLCPRCFGSGRKSSVV